VDTDFHIIPDRLWHWLTVPDFAGTSLLLDSTWPDTARDQFLPGWCPAQPLHPQCKARASTLHPPGCVLLPYSTVSLYRWTLSAHQDPPTQQERYAQAL